MFISMLYMFGWLTIQQINLTQNNKIVTKKNGFKMQSQTRKKKQWRLKVM